MAKVLPYSEEAEQAVLGAMLLERSAILRASAILVGGDFYREAHRLVFNAALILCGRLRPVDLMTLSAELERRDQLESAGGRAYLASLLDAVPTAEHVEHYARIVAEKATLRRLIIVAGEISQGAYAPEEVEDADEYAEACITKVADVTRRHRMQKLRPLDLIVVDVAQALYDAQAHPCEVTGLTTGVTKLDRLCNGLVPGNLSVISGSQGGGKTALAEQVAIANARAGVRVCYVSLEMDEVNLGRRIISHLSGVDGLRLRRGWLTADEKRDSDAALGTLAELPLDIYAPSTATPAQVLNWASDIPNLGLLVVDHLGLLRSSRRYGTRLDEEADRAEQLREGAKRMGLPILALSQHRKPAQDRLRGNVPTQQDLRGASELIDAAALILILHEPKPPQDGPPPRHREVRCIVAKNRYGPGGSVSLHWDAWCDRFAEMTEEEE